MWLVDRDCPHLADLEYLILSATALASEAYGVAIHRKLREMVDDQRGCRRLLTCTLHSRDLR